jgi:DNA-binding GntR family transcriptional regulator
MRAVALRSEEAEALASTPPRTVYERLRREILACDLLPGAPIYEQELADRFGVSKSPVREALLRLREQNLVEVQPRRGYRVKPISLKEVQEMYEMRLMYERTCVALAIEHATDAQIRQLKPLAKVKGEVDLRTWTKLNREYHVALASLCGNDRLAAVATEFIEQFDRLTYTSATRVRQPVRFDSFVEEHASILMSVAKRDKRRAQALIRDHIESSRARVLDALSDAHLIG